MAFAWVIHQADARLILPWAIPSFVIFGVSLVVIVSNHDTLSVRVQRDIPERLPLRALAFLFYNGAAGGLVWAALLMGATFIVMWLSQISHHFANALRGEDLYSILYSSAAAICYAFDYALVGLFLHRKFLARRPAKLAGIFAVIVPAAWALLPVLLFFFLNRLSARDLEHIQLGNLFNIFVVGLIPQKKQHLLFAACWLALMMLLNLSWFIRQVKSFQPLRRAKPAPAAVTPPILPATAN